MGVLTDYPFNLLDELVSESDDKPIFEGTQDQLDGLDYALSTLYEREHKVLLLRYKSGKTLKETGREFNVTQERIRQIEAKALRKLRHPTRMYYIKKGLLGAERCKASEKYRRAKEIAESEAAKPEEKEKQAALLLATPIEELDLSVRSFNCLKRAGKETVSDILKITDLHTIRNLGRKSAFEIESKMHALGLHGAWEEAE